MFVVGVALAHLAFWLDHVDGQVARWRGTASLDGIYLDYLMHHAANLATRLCAGIRPGGAIGRPALDDRGLRDRGRLGCCSACTTTAATRRSSSGSRPRRRATGSTAERRAPPPPAPWPRRGLAALTWPAYKACEPHVVLIGLTALALAAICAPPALADSVARRRVVMAILAPMLAIARIARAVAARRGRGGIRPMVPADRSRRRAARRAEPRRSSDGNPWTSPQTPVVSPNDG